MCRKGPFRLVPTCTTQQIQTSLELESSKAREEERERERKKERKKERARGEHLEDIIYIYILYIHVVCTQILDRWRMVDRWNIGIQ